MTLEKQATRCQEIVEAGISSLCPDESYRRHVEVILQDVVLAMIKTKPIDEKDVELLKNCALYKCVDVFGEKAPVASQIIEQLATRIVDTVKNAPNIYCDREWIIKYNGQDFTKRLIAGILRKERKSSLDEYKSKMARASAENAISYAVVILVVLGLLYYYFK